MLASIAPEMFQWKFGEAFPGVTQLSVLKVASDGTARELVWQLSDLPAGSCALFDAAGNGSELSVDDTCDGVPDRTVAAVETPFAELPPSVLAVVQDPSVLVGRSPFPGSVRVSRHALLRG